MTTDASNSFLRDYRTLIRIPTFEERFEYLRLDGVVCSETFGFDRYLNQRFYHSREWKRIRDYVIARDLGNDMALDGYPIRGGIIIHHMNPVRQEDIRDVHDSILNPDYLVCVSHDTHNAIHYGDENQLNTKTFVERTPFDTCPWRKGARA